jgi:hypothetical protein
MVGGVRFPFGPTGAQVVAPSFDPNNPPPYLRGLMAVNPNLARDLAADPGLRLFLDVNKSSLVQWEKPPQGTAADTLTWPIWCHATTIVPAAVRDEEYIVVVARGTAYQNAGRVRLPLQDGKNASSDGRIVFVGKTADFLSTQQSADEGGHYPGAINIDIQLPVAGAPGEDVSLAYCRVKPDGQGRVHPHRSAWPDSFQGVYGGYSGRELPQVRVHGGRSQLADSPDGCSAAATASVI